MPDKRTIAATIGRDTYLTKLENGVHTIQADEPAEKGGTDKAPTPGDLLRMSLASCTAITLRMYADRKGFDVSEIKVEVTSQEAEGKTVFHRHVIVSGTIDHDQRARMLHIANSCPVHKVLTRTITVNTVVSS
jgi:putative redox protein